MTTDREIGNIIAAARGQRSQTFLAAQLRGRGHLFHQQSLARVESGERPLRLTEAIDLAELLGITLDTFHQPPEDLDDLDWEPVVVLPLLHEYKYKLIDGQTIARRKRFHDDDA